jgi:hypothetical protein
MEQPDRVIGGIVGTKRIGADEFGKAIGAMRLGHSVRAHFVQDDADPGVCRLPGRFRAGEAAAYNMQGLRG